MPERIKLSPLRLQDTARLKAAGFRFVNEKDINIFLKELNARRREGRGVPISSCYFMVISEGSDSPFAIVGLEDISYQHRNAYIYCQLAEKWQWSSSSDQFDSNPTSINYEILQIEMVKKLLDYAFFTLSLHRLSWLIASDSPELGQVATAAGMRQEAILEEAYQKCDTFVDAGLFSLLISEYPDYGVAFVPFAKGLAALGGGAACIDFLHFYQYGEKISDDYVRAVAVRSGAATKDGMVKSKGTYHADFSMLPAAVALGAKELKEYFAKSRTRFSVKLGLDRGSDFQKQVWKALLQIPYGSTWSYEDVARILTEGDKVAARHLARAVGAACSENPLPIFVPCHRVIGKDGHLVGFAGGIENKEFLLEHEMFGFLRC